MRRALRRAATSYRIFILAALLLTVGTVGTTLAEFNGETTHAATVAGGWLDAPTALGTPTVSGYGAALAWTHGTHDLASQELWGTDRGTTTNCTGAAYATSFATGISATANAYTDSRGSTANGHWICYQMRSVHGSWYTSANFGIVQVGLVPTGITVTNSGGSAGQIEAGDTIDLSFNQNIAYSGASTITVCAFTGGTQVVLIGDSGCGSASDTPTIGKITGLSIPNANRTFETSTAAVTGGNTLRITLNTAAHGAQSRTAATGTGTFVSTGSVIQSSAGAAVVCTAANCTWTYSGGF